MSRKSIALVLGLGILIAGGWFISRQPFGDAGRSKAIPASSSETSGNFAAPSNKLLKSELNLSDLQAQAQSVMLVPSPSEMQHSLQKAGLSSTLGKLISPERKYLSMEVENKDNLAVRIGVVLADLVLTVQSSSKEEKLESLDKLKVGLTKLQAGGDIQSTINEMKTEIKTGKLHNTDDLLKEFEELSGIMIPELEQEVGDWVVPLIQAGAWLEGTYLVSTAIIQEQQFEMADRLLRHPHIAEYFLGYVSRKGRDRTSDTVMETLIEELKILRKITHQEQISTEDVSVVQQSTNNVLELL